MIPDNATNIVFISDLLPRRYPAVVDALRAALGRKLRLIPGTKDIWCRDFMPVQTAPDRFLQFRYGPDYLKDDPDLRTDDGASLLGLKNCVHSDLVVDGGNIVRWNDTAILTDKVFKENPGVKRPRLRAELERLLGVDRLVVIPKEPGDKFGHSDGVVRFVDHDTVLVNDYGKIDASYGQRLTKVLARHGLRTIPFPYCPTDELGPDPDMPPAKGVYTNFLQVEGTIFCPTFELAEDDKAISLLGRCFPDQQIIPVPCTALAMEGGVLNCATWNVRLPAR